MRTTPRWPPARRSWSTVPWWSVAAAVGAGSFVAYLAIDPGTPRRAALAGFGVAAGLAAVVGLRWHGPPRRTPFALLVTGQLALVVAAVGAPAGSAASAATLAGVHLLAAAGYLLVAAAILLLVTGAGRCDRAAKLDTAMAVIGAGTFAVLELSLPAWRSPGRFAWEPAVKALLPLFDLALLVPLLMLGLAAARHLPAYRTLAGCLLARLVGDLVDGWLGGKGPALGAAVHDAPLFASITLLAMTALHPSVRQLGLPAAVPGAGTAGPAGDWTVRRTALFVPTLVLPAVLLLTRPRSGVELVVIGVAMTSALLLLLIRARSALRAVHYVRAHDGLTGLLTRDAFVALLGSRLAAEDGEELWVAVVDLDGHRHAVQVWGHPTGDALVQQAAERLVAALPAGTPVARASVDVFAVILTGPRAAVLADAERLRAAVGARLDVNGLELRCGPHVGVAPARRGADPLAALRDADTAMNAARDRGADQVSVFEPRMRAGIERRAALEQALRYAAGSGELSVVYQPVVDLPTGRVIGAEALLRWTNPDFGTVPPPEFIQIAEETGMIEDLGSWVLLEACRRLASWDTTGLLPPDFTMAVNVSTQQLRDDGLPGRLREVLAETGVDPARVVLEVTESAMHEDQDAFIAVLRSLRAIGVQISIDDFGTGYSSLSYLSRLPATFVKLDRSLVRDVAVPPGDAIARAVQGIAQVLGLSVVAEGVESEQQRASLNALNIAHAQGYLWGRPVPPKDFLALVAPPAPRRPVQRAAP